MPEIELKYDTWGSYGQHVLDVLVLPDGSVVHPRYVTPKARGYSGRIVRKIGDWIVTVDGENNDSNKNIHRVARIVSIEPMPDYVVLKSVYQSAKNRIVTYDVINMKTGERLDPETEVVTEDVVKESDKYVYKVRVIKTLVVLPDGRRVPVETREEILEKRPKRLEIRVKIHRGMVAVIGDTYHIREVLKSNGFRWKGLAWLKPVNGDPAKAIEETVRMIKEYEAKIGIPITVTVNE